jgi:cytoskeleton protein RodZ
MQDTSILGVKAWRLRRGISLAAIAASTKLSVPQLEAIEAGQFNRLPGGIYNTNYIKQYARAIEFEEADLIAFYYHEFGPKVAPAAPEQVPTSRFSKLLFQH